jgi:hypothetical protein
MKKAASKRMRMNADAAPVAFDEDEWVKGTPYDVSRRKAAAAKAAGAKQA